MLQNIFFILLITELALAIVEQKIDTIVKNFNFTLKANNITPSILKKFFLDKIKYNLKANTFFFHSLIKEVFSVQKINVAKNNKNTSNTILLVAISRKICNFQYS